MTNDTSSRSVYLDHAAATPLDSVVLEAMRPYFTERFFNPSALYMAGHEVRQAVEAARARVAAVLGVKSGEVYFTGGGTEANNLAVQGIRQASPGGSLVVSAIEHDSVLKPALAHGARLAPVDARGTLDMAALPSLIEDDTVLVSVMYANNEIGTIQPLADVAALVAEERKRRARAGNHRPIYLHTDACQAAASLPLLVSRLQVDLMTLNGGKIYGPKGSGALYVRAGVRLQAVQQGGGQEYGLRSGTENVPGIIGFAAALEQAQQQRREETARLQSLQKLFFALLDSPRITINGHHRRRLPGNIHVTVQGHDNERLLMALDQRGVQAATGSACSAGSEDASHVLLACGLSEADARASLRLTMGRATTEDDVRYAAAQLLELGAAAHR